MLNRQFSFHFWLPKVTPCDGWCWWQHFFMTLWNYLFLLRVITNLKKFFENISLMSESVKCLDIWYLFLNFKVHSTDSALRWVTADIPRLQKRAGLKSLKFSRWYFGRNDYFIRTFSVYLTFRVLTEILNGQPYWTNLLDSLVGQPC